MHPYAKFGLLITAIVGSLAWLGAGGVEETKTYYKTIEEVGKMGSDAQAKRLRVAGDVDHIERNGSLVKFQICQKEIVKDPATTEIYTGTDPLPDTFRVGAQALADGKMGSDGVFQATRIQAKCASKYEAKPGMKNPNYQPPVNNAVKPTTQS